MIHFVYITQIFLYIANSCQWKTFTVHLQYRLAEVISCQDQILRLLVVINHENIHGLASLRFLKLNPEVEK